jgi:hypothetical protein
MTQAEHIVGVLLQEEGAEEFMRDVDFGPGGQMITLQHMDLVKSELNDFSRAVIRRTAQIMPELVKRGICREDQAPILAKLLAYYLADLHYNPKRWHEQWQKAAKRIFRYLPGNVSWTGGMSSLTRD